MAVEMTLLEEISSTLDTEWCDDELSTVDLGNKRLNERLKEIARGFSKHPSSPINQSSDDWISSKAAYRLFDNEKSSKENILRPHIQNTQNRMKSYQQVLVIQDTTTINYTSHHAVSGLGNIGNEHAVGFMQHNVLTLSPEGLPLGLIDQICWTRPEKQLQTKTKNKALPIEEKESYRWISSLETTTKRCPAGVESITICDRESDIYEFFDKAKILGAKVITRLKHDRQLENSEQTVKGHLQSQPVKTCYSFDVPKKKGSYPKRTVNVDVRYTSMTILPPNHIDTQVENSSLKMNGILITETNPPNGVEPIIWYLLTNCPIENHKDAMQVVHWYQLRWLIEIYHKVEKSCCKVEDCRLESPERLQRYLALKSIIAWRILYMTYISRLEPEAPAQNILSDIEVFVLQGKINSDFQKKYPKKKKIISIKSVRDAVRGIAGLGGFLGRAGDKEPGIITDWKGYMI